MKLRLILAPLLVASTAYAQAPGDDDGGGDLAPPGMAPVVAAPVIVVAPAQPARRWSVGLGVGSLELAPHVAPDAKTQFDIGQIYLRYRAWRHLEIELAVGGGSEATTSDGYQGTNEVSAAVLSLRYRFNPDGRWNWWAMAGMGTLAVTQQGAPDQVRQDANQSTLQFGGGVERRWSRFALQFELRAVGVAPHDAGDMSSPPTKLSPTGVMEPLPPNSEPGNANDGMKGGQFVFSGNYYF